MTVQLSPEMIEAARLTRAGRLAEAVELLQRGRSRSTSAGRETEDLHAGAQRLRAKVIDMAPPSVTGGVWTAPRVEPATALGVPEIPAELRALFDPLKQPAVKRRRAPSKDLPAGARFEERVYANAAGSRPYKLYIPSRYAAGQPLALGVMLHGCTQSPDDFAAGTRMNELAEEGPFLVAYPSQTQAANSSRCWNWFVEAEQRREGGEPSLIAGITREVMAEFAVDSRCVYVAGLSAGGAAAAIMGAAYPDLYAAVGVHSGLACGAARDMPSAFAAMQNGGRPSRAGSGASSRIPPTIVFHGDADKTVNPINGENVVKQAIENAPELSSQVARGCSSGGMRYTCTTRSQGGVVVSEQWILHGAGHAWAGGSPEGSYTDPRGPDASREMMRFFRQASETRPPAAK